MVKVNFSGNIMGVNLDEYRDRDLYCVVCPTDVVMDAYDDAFTFIGDAEDMKRGGVDIEEFEDMVAGESREFDGYYIIKLHDANFSFE